MDKNKAKKKQKKNGKTDEHFCEFFTKQLMANYICIDNMD